MRREMEKESEILFFFFLQQQWDNERWEEGERNTWEFGTATKSFFLSFFLLPPFFHQKKKKTSPPVRRNSLIVKGSDGKVLLP